MVDKVLEEDGNMMRMSEFVDRGGDEVVQEAIKNGKKVKKSA